MSYVQREQHLTGRAVHTGHLQCIVSYHALYLCTSQHNDCPKVSKLKTTATKGFAKQPAALKERWEYEQPVACASDMQLHRN